MPQTNQATDEVLDSLTGFDEMAIAEHFGRPVAELIPEPGMYRRTLIFVVKRREGLSEDDARNAALQMGLKDVLEFFPAPDSDEAEESGKDEPALESQPEPSLSSAS